MLRTISAIAAGMAVWLAAAPSQAQSACPAGFRFLAPTSCVSTRTPGCPRGYHLNPDKTLCLNDTGRGSPTHAASCPPGSTLRANLGCTITRAASCPAGKQINPRNGACVTGLPR